VRKISGYARRVKEKKACRRIYGVYPRTARQAKE
jgi:hypothetical protein